MNKIITVYQDKTAEYSSKDTLFRPDTQYPEYPFAKDISYKKNRVYYMVREAFHLAGYDLENYGTPDWNPLGEYIKKDNIVLLKPNLVMNVNGSGDSVDCLYTQPDIVAAVIDYVIIALKGSGTIVIGDAPMQECQFENLITESGYLNLLHYYQSKGIDISLVDFRELCSYKKNGVYHNIVNKNTKGTIIDLKNESEFAVYDKKHLEKLRITNYDPTILQKHHSPGKHEYYVSDYVLNADIIINLPKPKSHRKAGVTISLKNMVGINVRKEYLPHHCNGAYKSGGDEYYNKSIFKKIETQLLDIINYTSANRHYTIARFFKLIKKINSQIIKLNSEKYREGSWYGNRTISKTIADLNKIILYADKNGKICDTKQRKLLIIADLIISGEKEGPVFPTRKKVGIVAVGDDPVCFDEVIATLMGIDINKIPTLYQARNIAGKKSLIEKNSKALIRSNNNKWNEKYVNEINSEDTLHFIPSSGWIGHIEL